ncbi:MAG: hypothetical protein QOG43_2702 [Actinomycetota bacterium]|jgi:hypothetical protein|nr:hypothetical protein [Actinomycetota bacterium]
MSDPSPYTDVMAAPRPPLSGRRIRRAWLVVGAWAVVIAVASINQPPWALRRGALFLHLAALIAGFGAVLVVDLHGVLWLIGRRRLGDLLQVTSALQPLIWGGLTALVVSGLFLHPNLLLPRTQIKLVLVLVATLNGMWAHGLSEQLEAHPAITAAHRVDQRLLRKVMAAGAISQAAWWGATLIGFLATTSR